MNSPYKNIIVLSAGYGGISAALRLNKLFQKHYNIKIHLVDKNPFHTLKTQLHKAAVYKNEINIPIERIISKKEIIFHCSIVLKIDLKNKNVFLEKEIIPFIYIILALGSNSNFYDIEGLSENSFPLQTFKDAEISNLIKDSGFKSGTAGRIIVNQFLQAENFPFAFAPGDNELALNPFTGLSVPASSQFALQQGRLAAQNIFNEIYGYKKIPYKPKVWSEFISLGKHLAAGWLALPFSKKLSFIGFLPNLLNTVKRNIFFLLRKENRNWTTY